MPSSITLPDSRKFAYSLDTVPQDGPIVILANSLCATLALWDNVVPVLNKNGFRTLRYDQPGHGDSSAPAGLDTTFDSMADDVRFLLQSLDITKVHAWVGVSMGAATGVVFTTKFPGVVSRLAICDTVSCSPVNAGTEDAFGARVAAAREAGNMEATVEGTMERWFGKAWVNTNAEEAQRMRSLMIRTTVDGFESCCHALRSPSFDLRPLYGRVGASVDEAICVVGEKDANLPQSMEEMRAQIEEGFTAAGKPKKVELAVVKNAGHVCFIDGFDQFVRIITPFLTA
ncbi:3-oxoadipate enol-lactonase-like protein [Hapsidospora chrysogenum ATCC 11550]|uniref:3-oxoadipate enol-lactonase-like protein n=1 Tax=Hapsidospora chrysogenum (strain ATCC 11550 / CBS 779.69 / DSM 880 / IAM 14645 / JCM 23072 / IMI 49137) TaxID=857340 RepID=A0A086T6P8_HAPC1|nr:3-oxoadipate enol-lactonase-like protein [Hapsidospora chrysogenum ATCC 11550]